VSAKKIGIVFNTGLGDGLMLSKFNLSFNFFLKQNF